MFSTLQLLCEIVVTNGSNSLTFHTSRRHTATVPFIWCQVCVLLKVKCKSCILLRMFWSPPTPEENVSSAVEWFADHQLVGTDGVDLSQLFHWKQLSAAAETEVYEAVRQNWLVNQNNLLKGAKVLQRAAGNCKNYDDFWGDWSLQATPFTLHIVI